jgi:hypothetical protein
VCFAGRIDVMPDTLPTVRRTECRCKPEQSAFNSFPGKVPAEACPLGAAPARPPSPVRESSRSWKSPMSAIVSSRDDSCCRGADHHSRGSFSTRMQLEYMCVGPAQESSGVQR